MGQVRQDNVQIKLEIDGSQSKTELDNLTRKAQVLSTGLKEMKRVCYDDKPEYPLLGILKLIDQMDRTESGDLPGLEGLM